MKYSFKLNIMKRIILILFIFGLTFQSFAQIINDGQFPEIIVRFVNYKYISHVGSEEADTSVNVKLLQREVANYNIKKSELYELYQDEYDLYTVSFYIPDGKIVAAYDKNGKVIRTIEKFKDIKLPRIVLESVTRKFPGWVISKDVYRVYYYHDKETIKEYKLTLENGKERIKVKTDDKGKFI